MLTPTVLNNKVMVFGIPLKSYKNNIYVCKSYKLSKVTDFIKKTNKNNALSDKRLRGTFLLKECCILLNR